MGSEPVSSRRAWWLRRVGLVALLVVVGLGSWQVRRRFIRTWFADGVSGAAPRLTPAPPEATGVMAVERVRVVLLDGLAGETAARLPALSALCAGGLDVRVDVGFPTVSLPVQAVLWTGRTQQQSGIQYRVAALPGPPPGAAPAAIADSVAVAEEQAFIAGSFGFSMVAPPVVPPVPPLPAGWTAEAFAAAAETMVATARRLVFVHVLRIDKAGHKGGLGSPAYEAAASWADQLLARLVAVAPPDPATRWMVLSDHGHRPRGGHGGSERAVRLVRACLAGGGQRPDRRAAPPVHLVDLSRALFDSLALPPPPDGAGRPIWFALDHPDLDATVPRATPLGLAAAAALAAAGLVLTLVWFRSPLAALPCWLPVSYASVVLVRGLPTLSNPIVYPPLGRDIVLAGAPGLVLLALLTVLAVRRASGALPRVCLAQLAAPVTAALACLAACRGLGALVGLAGSAPPLLPLWTAHASVLLSLLSAAGLLLAAIAAAATAATAWAARRPAALSAPRAAPTP